MIVLIPSYEPDARLVDVVRGLRERAPEATVLVVDDGSGPEYDLVFDVVRASGAEVIGHPVNRGKGYALKAGFAHIRAHQPDQVVVCADSDGQHRVPDILRVAARAEAANPARQLVPVGPAPAEQVQDAAPTPPTARPAPPTPPEATPTDAVAGNPTAPTDQPPTDAVAGSVMVIGGRRFTGRVPARSRLGNSVSRALFRAATGTGIGDTQTGLRAYPPALLPWLESIDGDRFEYELNLLLAARASGIDVDEIAIDTVYLEQNASSHFRPVVDSLRVMRPFGRYLLSSLGAFVLDLLALQLLFAATASLPLAVVGARLISASANFVVNRQLVFRGRERRPVRRDAVRYAALAVGLLAANLGLLELLTHLAVPLLAAKVVTELTLYLAGYLVQRRFVFSRRASQRSSPRSWRRGARSAHPSRP